MKGETEVASGDSWKSGRPDVHCTLYIDFPFAKQPVRVEGLGGDAGAGVVFRRPSGLRGKRFPMFSAMKEKCTFAKNLSKQVKGMGLKELSSLKWCKKADTWLKTRMSTHCPLKQGLRHDGIIKNHCFISVTVYSTKTRIKTPFADKIRLSCNKSQYIPLKQGSFSIQNYEFRIKNERRNGVASGDSWKSGRPDVHCSLYIVHYTL